MYAGIITAGLGEDYGGANIKYGFQESRNDHSIVAELSNGARYYKKRDITRAFSVSARMLTDEYHALMDSFDISGAIPTAWRLIDNTNTEWLIYGYAAITASHDYPQHSTVNITINEVV